MPMMDAGIVGNVGKWPLTSRSFLADVSRLARTRQFFSHRLRFVVGFFGQAEAVEESFGEGFAALIAYVFFFGVFFAELAVPENVLEVIVLVLAGARPSGRADGQLGRGFRVDDDARGDVRLESRLLEVGGRDLQPVKHESGALLIDLAGEEKAQDFHECDLDGVSVFEQGQGHALPLDDDGLVAPSLVKVAEALLLEGGRSALRSVGLDVLASGDVFGIDHG